jgi:hypothetical protein
MLLAVAVAVLHSGRIWYKDTMRILLLVVRQQLLISISNFLP